MIVLAFDFGLRRIGVATANRIIGISTPLTTLQSTNQQPDWLAISSLIEEWKPECLIVGIPYHLDGSESEITARAKKFSRQLNGRYQLPVEQVNEVLTSREANQRLKQSRQMGRKKKIQKQEIDAMAACIILETWIAYN